MIKNENVEGEPAYDETYRRGPVVMRGPMIPKDNTYANLLAPEDSTDWLHADPWRVLRIQAEFVDGFGALAELGPAVTIFGSARTPKTDPLYKAARTAGRKIRAPQQSFKTCSMARLDSKNLAALFSLRLTFPSPKDVMLFTCRGLYNGLRMNRNQGVPVYGPEPI